MAQAIAMSAIFAQILTIVGGLFIAAATYWFTKKKEREAEWRKEKLAYYKAFVGSLSGVVNGEHTHQNQKDFSKAVNNLMLFAPQLVLNELYKFVEAITLNKNLPLDEHDKLLSDLLYQVRKDVGIYPPDNVETFIVHLRSSGNHQQ